MQSRAISKIFNGTKTEFNAFQNEILDMAESSSIHCQYGQGLLGFILSAAEWNILPFQTTHDPPVAFEPIPAPGAKPVIGANPDGLAVAIYNARLQDWKLISEGHLAQIQELQNFKVALLQALGPVPTRLIQDPSGATRNTSVANIYAILCRQYNTLTSTDLKKNKAILEAPINPGVLVQEYISGHIKAHAVAYTNGQPFSEFDKVQFLQKGIKSIHVLHARVAPWLIEFPAVADQRFMSLATALQTAEDNAGTDGDVPTMQTMQSTAAVKGLPSTQAELDAYTAAAIKAEKQRRRKDTASGDTTKPARTPWDPNFKGKHYCYTHGWKSHTSSGCTKPGPDHTLDDSKRNPKHDESKSA